MDENQIIGNFIKMLDSGMEKGVGHINVNVDEGIENLKKVQTMECTDCSGIPLACSVPTLEETPDDFR